MPTMNFYTSCTHVKSGACSTCAGKMDSRISELEDAIRGVILCTKEPGGACVCIQYAETILNKK